MKNRVWWVATAISLVCSLAQAAGGSIDNARNATSIQSSLTSTATVKGIGTAFSASTFKGTSVANVEKVGFSTRATDTGSEIQGMIQLTGHSTGEMQVFNLSTGGGYGAATGTASADYSANAAVSAWGPGSSLYGSGSVSSKDTGMTMSMQAQTNQGGASVAETKAIATGYALVTNAEVNNIFTTSATSHITELTATSAVTNTHLTVGEVLLKGATIRTTANSAADLLFEAKDPR